MRGVSIMKKLKTKLLNVLLVSAFGAAVTFGTVAAGGVHALADEESGVILPSKIFTATSSASVGADETDSAKTAFVFPNGGKISYRRDLALKWFSGKDEQKYLSMTFSLKEVVFKTLTFTFEAGVASANKDSKAVNTVVFEKKDDGLFVSVNDGTEHSVNADSELALTLNEVGVHNVGDFNVVLNGETIGTFTNIGAAFADYSASGITPLVITAVMPEENKTAKQVVIFKELNGQDFTLGSDGKIAQDTAEPVLVVNDEISGFALGATFSLDYEVIDVVDSSLSKTLQFYQYNPTDTEADYKSLSTSTTFSDTTYTLSDGTKSTVYNEEGCEFVSIKIKIEDDKYKGDTAKTYDLSWYAESVKSPVNTKTTENESVAQLSYIPVELNENAPTYLWNESECKTYEEGVLAEAAKEANAGSSSYVYLPSVRGMFSDDDTSYKSLLFNIYYKSQSATGGSSLTNKSYDDLKIPVSNPGWYEFKIVAVDKSGNVAEAKDEEGNTVSVTSDNVWDLDSVPSFRFKVVSSELEITDDKVSERQKSGTIDVEVTVDEFEIDGPSDYSSEYALYFFDINLFKEKYPEANVDKDILSSIAFSSLTVNVSAGDDYVEKYAERYAFRLSELVSGITAEGLLTADENGAAILRRIGDRNENVSEDVYPDNAYEWNSEAKTFVPASGGTYIVFGVFGNNEQLGKTVGGYRVITVNATEDEIPGETQWLKNNIASVILFSIAGVMLVIICILSLVKPSDETLEDIDKKKAARSARKK